MSVDYKTMSRDKALDQLDLIPSWAFWREGCHTFAKNVCKVMEMAGQDYSIICVAGLEIYCIHSDRMQQRLRPLQN